MHGQFMSFELSFRFGCLLCDQEWWSDVWVVRYLFCNESVWPFFYDFLTVFKHQRWSVLHYQQSANHSDVETLSSIVWHFPGFCAVTPQLFILCCMFSFIFVQYIFFLIHIFGRRHDLDLHADSIFRIGHDEMILSSQSSHRGERKLLCVPWAQNTYSESIVEK